MKKFQSNRALHSRRPYKKLTISVLAIAVIAGSLIILDAFNVVDLPFFKDKIKVQESTNTNNGINYGPPTEEEKKETEAFKESQGSGNDSPSITPSVPGQIKTVTPVITSWGQNPQTKDVEVSGFVPGVIENGGSCTVTLEKDGQKVTKSATGTANAQNVSCGLITIPFSEISAGTWNILLSYSSSTASGSSSQNVSLEVQ